MKFPVVLCFVLKVLFARANCPSLCVCKSRQNEASTADTSELIKFKCGGPENPISELKEIDLSRFSISVQSLNLSGNEISTLSRELNLSSLQNLDLSKNQISLIETDAFYNLDNLQRLDLSGNLIQTVYKEIFKSLHKLERLVLAQNRIETLSAGTFEYLSGLKQLDVSENPLKCDCNLVWLGEWSQYANVKLLGNPKCSSPQAMSGHLVQKLKLEIDLAACTDVSGLPINALVLKPHYTQIVFEGDSMILKCRAPFTPVNSVYELKWLYPETLLNASELVVRNVDVMEEGLAESIVSVPRLAAEHSGQWSCRYGRDHHATLTQRLQVLVVTNRTRYCPPEVTVGNRGSLFWPLALQGHVVRVPCAAPGSPASPASAVRLCDDTGIWATPNASACPYSSETTQMLQHFALLNLTVSKGTALAAAHRLISLVERNLPPGGALTDDDVHFVSRAVHNYLHYATQEKDLGWALLDILSLMLHFPHSVMLKAEQQFSACTALVLAAEDISKYTGSAQSHKMNIALERMRVRRSSFTGVTCVWYANTEAGEDAAWRREARQLHCSTTNLTKMPLLISRQNIISSVQIPPTLLYGMDNSIDSPLSAINKVYNLVVAMYSSATLFPVLPRHEGGELQHRTKDYYGFSTKRDDMNMEITSPVVGVKLVDVSAHAGHRLAEPVYITVRDAGLAGVQGRAVMWDEQQRKWSDAADTGCSVSHIVADMVVIRCYRLGYVALLQSVESGYYGQRTSGARFKLSHPAVYVGGLVLLLCLSTEVLTYTLCYSSVRMPDRAKHALINTWISMAALCFLYTLGIYQTENLKLCQMLGLAIHYFSLSSLLWMVVSAWDVYKSVSKNDGSNLRTPENDVDVEGPVRKPILGLYLVGWGISLIVCGISGAVDLRDYASYSQCFLSNAPSLGALFVPAGILVTFLGSIYLSTRCTIRDVDRQLSEGTQATENGDSEGWEEGLVVHVHGYEMGRVGSESEDAEHACGVRLQAHVVVLTLYVCVWTCGAVAVYRPFPEYLPYQEDIFSILYALCATFLGTFNLFFYGIARSDVRAQWLTMQCHLGKSEPCNRSIFDTDLQGNLSDRNELGRALTETTGETRSMSDSQASNKTGSKTNDRETLKGAELNGHVLPRDVKNGTDKKPSVDFVGLRRQRCPANGQRAEVFYNLNQSNVARKFFKKQKQNIKKNCFEIPNSRHCDSDINAYPPLASREMNMGMADFFNSGSRVNNKTIHMEKEQPCQDGLNKTRQPTNPNVLLKEDVPITNHDEKYKLNEKEQRKCNNEDDAKFQDDNSMIMNIYTNVPETNAPHRPRPRRVSAGNSQCRDGVAKRRSTVSEECLSPRAHNEPPMRTVSQQCSLQYSSASELEDRFNQSYSDRTLDTPSEFTSPQDTRSNLFSANEITTDTESFSRYIDYLRPSRITKNLKDRNEKLLSNASGPNKSLEDNISEVCTSNGNPDPEHLPGISNHITDTEILESNEMISSDEKHIDCLKENLGEQKKHYYLGQSSCEFDTTSMHASEQGFENESDVYYPNYQVSEVSIRSHGLYAPSPASICRNEMSISFSNEDVSNNENQYVNFNPAWRNTPVNKSDSVPKFVSSPVLTCREENGDNPSPVSFVSELETLYTQITNNKTPRVRENDISDSTVESDVTFKLSDT